MGVEQRVSEEELIETLRAFEKNRVEQLEEPARNLFYAIMKIAGERDRLHSIIKETIDFVESMEYCGQEDYFYDLKAKDECGNDNTFDDSKHKLLEILKGSDKE